MKKYIYFLFLILISCRSEAQTKEQLILGEWTEVRRESRDGHQTSCGTPSIELSFEKNSKGTFYNPQTRDPKTAQEYIFKDNFLIFGGRIYEIEKISQDTLKFIIRIWNTPENTDLRSTFIRNSIFKNLAKSDVEKLNAPTKKEKAYQDSLYNSRKNKKTDQFIITQPEKDDDVFEFADQLPTFPGGQEKYNQFIIENFKYPNDANVYGKIYVSFIVEKDGTLSDIKILRGLEKDFNAEAIRVLKLMPKWNPGKQNGKTVRIRMTQFVKISPN